MRVPERSQAADELSVGHRVPPREILVVKPSSLGDIVHTLPAVARIKRTYPTARLRWLINTEWAPLLADNPDVDDVVLFPRQEFKGIRGGVRFASWARVLRRNVRADLILDFQGLLRSAFISRLCRASGGKIIGLSDAREGSRFFYDQVTDVSGKPHAVDRYLAMVDSLDASSGTEMEWPLPLGSAPSGFSACEPFVLLHPFSRGAGKSLSLSDIADFCAALAPQKIVVAGRSDAELPTFSNGTNLLNQTTLLELIWLIRHALFVVSVDSGPMHIAAALTPRLLSLHTWSDPRKVGPYRPEAWVWQHGTVFQQKSPEKHFPATDLRSVGAFVSNLLRGAEPPITSQAH